MKYLGLLLLALTALLSGCATEAYNREFVGFYVKQAESGVYYKYKVYAPPDKSLQERLVFLEWAKENVNIDSTYMPPAVEIVGAE